MEEKKTCQKPSNEGTLKGIIPQNGVCFVKDQILQKCFLPFHPFGTFFPLGFSLRGYNPFLNNDILTGDMVHGIGLDLKPCQTRNVRGGDTVP